MNHFGFVSPPFRGHLDPMRALARELVGRGHRVTFFGMPEAGGLVADPRWGFAALGASIVPEGSLADVLRHMAAPGGAGLFRVLGDMARLTDMLCRELPAAARRLGIDAIVADQLEPAGGLAATALGLPFVSVANALPIDRDPALPPPFTGWGYDPSPRGIERNRWGYRVVDLMMRGMATVLRRRAAALGLPARSRIEDWVSPYAQISQLPAALDFPRSLPSAVHGCGPLRDGAGPEAERDLLGDGRPLVFASLGTLQGGRLRLFRAIAKACASRGLHLVIAHGGRMSGKEAESLAGPPVVRDFVPQRSLLRHAALLIGNGGLNTVLDALSAGVPALVLPIAFEQGAIAARLVRVGAGTALPHRGATAGRLGRRIDLMLGQPRFAQCARHCAAVVAAAGGVARAASIAEAVARTGRPVAREVPC